MCHLGKASGASHHADNGRHVEIVGGADDDTGGETLSELCLGRA